MLVTSSIITLTWSKSVKQVIYYLTIVVIVDEHSKMAIIIKNTLDQTGMPHAIK